MGVHYRFDYRIMVAMNETTKTLPEDAESLQRFVVLTIRYQLAFSFPAPQRRNRHAQRYRGFAYRYIPIHNERYKLVMDRFQVNCSNPYFGKSRNS